MKMMMVTLSLMLLIPALSPAYAWAGNDTFGVEMHADSPIIAFADKYLGEDSMIHLWAVPGGQINILFRYNFVRMSALPKFEFGSGPGFSMVDDHQAWTHYSFELDHKMVLGPVTWNGYQLAQLQQHNDFEDSAVLREQFFYKDCPLGIVGENQFAHGQQPKPFWGLVYNFGQTAWFGTNKFFLALNLTDTDQVWAAWIIEL